MLLVRSYRTLAPLPVLRFTEVNTRPSAVCFCGTLLTVTRTGRYPASLAIREPGLSSTGRRWRPEDRSDADRDHLACFRFPSCLRPYDHGRGAVAQPDRATVS